MATPVHLMVTEGGVPRELTDRDQPIGLPVATSLASTRAGTRLYLSNCLLTANAAATYSSITHVNSFIGQ